MSRVSTRGDAGACSHTALRCASGGARRHLSCGLHSGAMDRNRFEEHRRIERQDLASGSQWHLSRQREVLGIFEGVVKPIGKYADVAPGGGKPVRENRDSSWYSLAFGSSAAKCLCVRLRSASPSYVETDFACQFVRFWFVGRDAADLDEARRRRAKSGWEAGIRTPITWSRATCPTVERPPSVGLRRERILNCSGPGRIRTSRGVLAELKFGATDDTSRRYGMDTSRPRERQPSARGMTNSRLRDD